MNSSYWNYVGVGAMVVLGIAMAHYWPDQQLYAGGFIGIGMGWLGKHLSS